MAVGIKDWLLRLATVIVALASIAPRPTAAQVGSDRYSSIVIDAASGAVLSAANADDYRFPASLTKMMTIYMLFEALRDRRTTLGQPVPVSSYASSMSPTKLGLLPGTYITVEQALLGLVTKSANDAAAALGEMLGGDEERFAQMMTLRARALGMSNTTFRNASGLPDWSQVTTARDMAVLGRRLVQDFPDYYHYFSTPSFVFQGRTVMNHQRLLQTYPGADGLKTGYIIASGYNVVTSALRGNTRLVGVVLGASSGAERDDHMADLLDQGFERTGTPMMVSARREPGFRLPFVAAAQAAPIVLRPMQVAEARTSLFRLEPARSETYRFEPARAPFGRAEAPPYRASSRSEPRVERSASRAERPEPRGPRAAPTAIRATVARAAAPARPALQAARPARVAEPPRATRGNPRVAGTPARIRG